MAPEVMRSGLEKINLYFALIPIVSFYLAMSKSLTLPHKVPTSASPSVTMKAVPMNCFRSTSRKGGPALVPASSSGSVKSGPMAVDSH